MPDGSISVSCVSHFGTSSYLGHAHLIAKTRQLHQDKPSKTFKMSAVSDLLTLHWPKRVTWVSPTEWEKGEQVLVER